MCIRDRSPGVHRILREELNFDGIIITDDLYMDAIRKFTGDEEAAVSAVQAGNDMICCTDFTVQIPAVLDAVSQGKITEDRIDESVDVYKRQSPSMTMAGHPSCFIQAPQPIQAAVSTA